MKKIVFLLFLAPFFLNAQQTVFKMGGVKFEDCTKLISFRGQDILSLKQAPDGSYLLHADVFNEAGQLVATVRDNVTTGRIAFAQASGEVTLTDKSTGRKICHFLAQRDGAGKRTEIAVTLNYYLPTGRKLESTPERSNDTQLEKLKGSNQKGSETALILQ